MQAASRYSTPKSAKAGAPAAQRYAPLTFSKPVEPPKKKASSKKKGASDKPTSKAAGSSKRVVAPQQQQQQQQQQQPQPVDESTDDPSRSSGWTPEQLAEAKATSQEFFDAPLNEVGNRRVRVTTFGATIGIDLREFFQGQYGDLQGQWLPSGRGFRLRVDEWEALKAISGNIDEALHIVMNQGSGGEEGEQQ